MTTGSDGHVVFVLHSHLPWVLGHGRWPHGEHWLFEAAAECYLPLLRTLDRFAADGCRARLTIGITPILSEMLAAARFRERFVTYLEERKSLAERDRNDFDATGDAHLARLAESWVQFYAESVEVFTVMYGRDLLGAFRRHQDEGRIEILASAATHGYLPLLGRDVSIQAQIRGGTSTYQRHFGREPRGIWLPECAYRPGGGWSRPVGPPRAWNRPGIEEFLASTGLRHFFVDTHLVAGGAPLGTYDDRFDERRLDASGPASGLSPNDIHEISTRSRRRVAVFARDPRSSVQVWSADYGYPGDGAYLEFHRKRGKGGLRYWRITDRGLPLDAKIPYDPQGAAQRALAHAEHFAGMVRDTLREHRQRNGRAGVVVAPFDTELFGHWWFEGPRWLEAVLRSLDPDGLTATASECLERIPPRRVVRLPEGSWGQGGHHWVWMNDDTKWVWEHVYTAEDDFQRMLEKVRASREPNIARVVKQLARELLLLEASDWPFLITTASARDYAEGRVRLHVETFRELIGMATRAEAGDLAEPDRTRLAEIEARDSPFPDVDLRWWSEER